MELDHIMYAVPDLDAGVRDIATRAGAAPVYGGAHPGRGTHNALLSLGASQYLEIIAPDPAQAGTPNDLDVTAPAIKTWAVATDDLVAVQRVCDQRGLGANKVAMSRNTPAGPTLNWELLFVSGHGFGDLFPFFIDWLESPHPAATTLRGGVLESFTVSTREPDRYRELLAAFDIRGIEVIDGPDALHAGIRNTGGELFEL